MNRSILQAIYPGSILTEVLADDLDADFLFSIAPAIGKADPETQRKYLEALPMDMDAH